MGDRHLSELFEWLYLAVLLFAGYQLVHADLAVEFILVIVSVFVVVTGWISFRATTRAFSSPSLFLIDVALMMSYGLLIASTTRSVTATDQVWYWATSGAITALYCAWDVVAYAQARSDGATEASVVQQLRRFAFAMAAVSPGFLALAAVQVTEWSDLGGVAFGLGLVIWLGILVAWNVQAARSRARQ